MINSKKLASDIVIAIVSQGLATALNVVVMLVLPKLMGVEEFGYYQLFIFYISYVGFFHLGINDGVYLLKGGQLRDQIDKTEVNSQFWFSCIYQLAFSAILFAVAILGPFEEKREFVIASTAIILTVNNAGFFLGYLFQAMNETRLFSYSTALESAVFFIAVITLISLRVIDFQWYVLFYCIAKSIRFLYCMFHAKDFLKAGTLSLSRTIKVSLNSISAGIKLMTANLVGAAILGVIRFLIDLDWGIEVFSIVSFSLSIASFFLLFLSQVSMVLFPALRRLKHDELSSSFVVIRDSLSLLLPLLYIGYAPIAILLNLWMPNYSESIRLFILLFPLCIFDGKMDIVGTTYFKVVRGEGTLLKINLATLGASFVLALIGTYVFHSVEVMLVGVVLLLAARNILSEHIIAKELACALSKVDIGLFMLSAVFVFLFETLDYLPATCLYCGAYVLYLACFRKQSKMVFGGLLNRIIKK